jgi:hypothetical protein
MQLSDLTDFSKIREAVNQISADSAGFRLMSPADKDDSRKILEGRLRLQGINDPADFFKAVEDAVKRTGITSPEALYTCPPTADIAHLLIEKTLEHLDRQKNASQPATPVLPPDNVVTGANKGVDRIIPVSSLPTPVRSTHY